MRDLALRPPCARIRCARDPALRARTRNSLTRKETARNGPHQCRRHQPPHNRRTTTKLLRLSRGTARVLPVPAPLVPRPLAPLLPVLRSLLPLPTSCSQLPLELVTYLLQ